MWIPTFALHYFDTNISEAKIKSRFRDISWSLTNFTYEWSQTHLNRSGPGSHHFLRNFFTFCFFFRFNSSIFICSGNLSNFQFVVQIRLDDVLESWYIYTPTYKYFWAICNIYLRYFAKDKKKGKSKKYVKRNPPKFLQSCQFV